MLWSEPIKNLLSISSTEGKPLMDMTLAEMDVFGKRRSFWQKRGIRKF
jgi:hypothetical protein